jgi:hypothetical protein
MTKYICAYDEDLDDFEVTLDDQNYDGPETLVGDPEYTYHVEAASVTEAREIANDLKYIEDYV